MKRAKTESMVRLDPNYIFYVCLALVIAIAVYGIATDVAGR
jgi:preprotein translocase subunit Sec61beta